MVNCLKISLTNINHKEIGGDWGQSNNSCLSFSAVAMAVSLPFSGMIVKNRIIPITPGLTPMLYTI